MPRRKNGKLPREENLVPLHEVARRLGMCERTVQKDWKSIKAKLGWLGIPEKTLGKLAVAVARNLEPLPAIGCGSVECRRDWIEMYGDYFDIPMTTPSRLKRY